jgi:hypothetical protein
VALGGSSQVGLVGGVPTYRTSLPPFCYLLIVQSERPVVGMTDSDGGEARSVGDDGVGGEVAKGVKGSRSKKPDFSSDPKFDVLVPLFMVSSSSELNKLCHHDFKRKASELSTRVGETRPIGSFKTWTSAVDFCLSHAAAAPMVVEAEPTAEAFPAGAPAASVDQISSNNDGVEDADEAVKGALGVVHLLLSGEEIDLESMPELTESALEKYAADISRHADTLEHGFRAQMDALEDTDHTVLDILNYAIVRMRTNAYLL